VKTSPLFGLESEFANLAADSLSPTRVICAYWIGRRKRDDDLPVLRQLAKDKDSRVRVLTIKNRERQSDATKANTSSQGLKRAARRIRREKARLASHITTREFGSEVSKHFSGTFWIAPISFLRF
jgi:hypothetical protein